MRGSPRSPAEGRETGALTANMIRPGRNYLPGRMLALFGFRLPRPLGLGFCLGLFCVLLGAEIPLQPLFVEVRRFLVRLIDRAQHGVGPVGPGLPVDAAEVPVALGARNYDISIDVRKFGLNGAVDFLMKCIE